MWQECFTNIYIYIHGHRVCTQRGKERERERKRETEMQICIYKMLQGAICLLKRRPRG